MTALEIRLPRHVAGVGAVFAIGAALVVALASAASAHAGLTSSNPSDGQVLPTAPASITMSFSEPPDPDLSSVTVLDASGAMIETGPLERGVPPRSLELALPDDLGDGVYTVSWIVVSEADGHLTPGVFAFGVGVASGEVAPAPEAAALPTPGPSPLAVAGKVLLYAGLVLSVGAAVTGLAAFGGVVAGRRALLPFAGAAAFVGAVVMTIAEADVVGASVGDLLASASGRSYVWLLATAALTLVAALVGSLAASRSAGRAPLVAIGRAPLVAIGVAAAATMFVRATSGHAAALVPAWPAELAQFAHLLAIGVWIGGLLPLLLLVRERSAASEPPPVIEAKRFSRMAGWALLAVVITGMARTVAEAGGIGHVRAMLTDTSYGAALIVKVAFAVGLIGLGAFNRRRSIPRLATDGTLLRRVIAIEVVGALGVFGLTGTLTSLNPNPPGASPTRAAPSIAGAGADFATTTRVTLTASPGTAGPNTFEAIIVDYDGGTPVEADEVTVLLSAIGRPEIEPATLLLGSTGTAASPATTEPSGTAEGGPATWTGIGTQLSLAGAWDAVVQVRSGARTIEVPLILVTRAPPTASIMTEGSGDLPDIETFTLSTGDQIQVYLDPGAAGANELHVTAFDAQGDELPLSGLVVVAVAPEGQAEALDTTRLTPGHFSASVEVDPGLWRFQVVATSEGGTVLQATHEQEIEP
ncbi:MAG: copper resistance protein CopC [Actinomycetota bacterium]